MTIQLFTKEGHATTAGNTLIKPPRVVHQFPNGTTIEARSTIGPACRPAGVTAGRAASRPTGVTASRAAGRPAGTGRAAVATPYPDLRSFGFGDEVIEEKAVLLLFKVEVVELNEE